jgi:hypothetical protein
MSALLPEMICRRLFSSLVALETESFDGLGGFASDGGVMAKRIYRIL